MAVNFYTLITTTGKAKMANAAALGTKVNFKTLKVGDGNGNYYEPTENQTNLLNTVWQGNIGSISIDENNSNWIVTETTIPATDGGFFIREAGIFDEDGNLIAISKMAETYKPVAAEGSTKNLIVQIILEVSNSSSVTLKIDPNVVIATKKDIDVLTNSINSITTQLSDLVYQVAGGTATALTIQMQSLVNGYAKTFIASSGNNGAATTINGKSLYKPNTTTAPNLIAGKAYTVWYNSSKDCFFIKASAEGNTIAAHVLAGDTFSNDSDTGLLGTLDLSQLTSANIKSGVTINGVTGKASVVDTADATANTGQILNGQSSYVNGLKVTGNMPNHSGADSPANSIAGTGPGRIYVRPQYGYYDGSVASYVDDGNFVESHILSGITIFGVAGNAQSAQSALTLTPGTTTTIYSDTLKSGSYNGIVKSAVNQHYGGTVTVTITFGKETSNGTSTAQIYVNGSARGSVQSIATGGQNLTYSENITINSGDTIQVYVFYSYVYGLTMSCGNNYGTFAKVL